jgi:hypothetical protein
MLKYTDITENSYVQSWTVTEIMAREAWNFDSCYTLIDYQIHIKNLQQYVVSVMLISVRDIKLTCEWHKAIKLNYKKTRPHAIVVLRGSKHYTWHMYGKHWHNMTDFAFWYKGTTHCELVIRHHTHVQISIRLVSWQVQCVDPPEDHTFLWPFSP